jgi:hypothetical protein
MGWAGRSFGSALKLGKQAPGLLAQLGQRGVSTMRKVQGVVHEIDKSTGGVLRAAPVLGAGIAAFDQGGVLDRGLGFAERGVRTVEKIDDAIGGKRRKQHTQQQLADRMVSGSSSGSYAARPLPSAAQEQLQGYIPPAPEVPHGNPYVSRYERPPPPPPPRRRPPPPPPPVMDMMDVAPPPPPRRGSAPVDGRLALPFTADDLQTRAGALRGRQVPQRAAPASGSAANPMMQMLAQRFETRRPLVQPDDEDDEDDPEWL